MDCIVHGVAKSRIQLNNFHFHFNIKYKTDGQTEMVQWNSGTVLSDGTVISDPAFLWDMDQ